MARRPHVLLIDELSFSLAPAICDRLFATIRDFADQGRLCVAASSSWMRSPRRAAPGCAARGEQFLEAQPAARASSVGAVTIF
jgi:hypothetical protein